MKVEKFKVLLYLKKSGLDKSGKAPIMGRITVNRTMAQFGCKLSCTPELWNPRASDFYAQPDETFLFPNPIKIYQKSRKRSLKQGVYFIDFEKGTFGNN